MKVLANFEDNHKIPTNSGIDNLLDGGVEKGTVTQIFGPPGSGAAIFLQKNAKLRLTFCAAIAIIALAVRRCATENVERWLSWSKAHDWKSCFG